MCTMRSALETQGLPLVIMLQKTIDQAKIKFTTLSKKELFKSVTQMGLREGEKLRISRSGCL